MDTFSWVCECILKVDYVITLKGDVEFVDEVCHATWHPGEWWCLADC